MHGVDIEDKQPENLLMPKECKRCKTTNQATNRFCCLCGLPLDEKVANEILVNDLKRKQADDVMDMLLEDDEFREFCIKR
jgi:hypothetical protein